MGVVFRSVFQGFQVVGVQRAGTVVVVQDLGAASGSIRQFFFAPGPSEIVIGIFIIGFYGIGVFFDRFLIKAGAVFFVQFIVFAIPDVEFYDMCFIAGFDGRVIFESLLVVFERLFILAVFLLQLGLANEFLR